MFCAIHPDHWDILRDLTPAKCGHTAWATLHAHYIKDTPSHCLRLCEFFYSLSYSATTGITGYSNSLKGVVRDFLDIGIPYPELRFLTSFLLVFPLIFPPFGQLSVGNTMMRSFFSRMQLPSISNLNVR
jgi:hypothetical protein